MHDTDDPRKDVVARRCQGALRYGAITALLLTTGWGCSAHNPAGGPGSDAGAPDGGACAENLEVCDGVDNNCNGVIDEGDPGGGQPCDVPEQLGVCREGTTHCFDWAVHCVQLLAASPEACDGLDNDCDGVVDNDPTGTGDACDTGLLGVCAAGTSRCVDGAPVCAQDVEAHAEVCNGLDDDCDGTPDQDSPGAGQPCTVAGQPPDTPCAQGLTTCQDGATTCTQVFVPGAETCDGIDDDCDGTVDNSAAVDGIVCDTGLPGVCATGVTLCTDGVSECVPDVAPGAQVEICDGQDNDCNGSTDDVAAPDLECAARFPGAQHVAGWACVASQCEIQSCEVGYHDNDTADATGCECQEDAVPNSCTNAANVGTITYGGATVRSGNLAEPGDVDWWLVTFQKTQSCAYKPKIVLSAGTRPVLMRVYPGCSSGLGVGRFRCKEANPSYSDSLIQLYEVEFLGPCGYQSSGADTSPNNPLQSSTDGFFEQTLPAVVYVKVESTGSSLTCFDYSLTFSN